LKHDPIILQLGIMAERNRSCETRLYAGPLVMVGMMVWGPSVAITHDSENLYGAKLWISSLEDGDR
jgi:hypothetical protein